MIYSMTGYGRCETQEHERKIIVEMNAVNHRYCDLNIRLPKTLIPLEEQLRNLLKGSLTRGKIEVNVTYYSMAKEDLEVIINEALATEYVKGLRKLASLVQVEDDLSLKDLMQINDVMSIQKKAGDLESIEETLFTAVKGALQDLLSMRLKEGEALKEDILEKIFILEKYLKYIEIQSPQVVLNYKVKLENRLATLLEDSSMVDQSRLAMEVALFADKCAIDEEITRFKSHIAQLRLILNEGGVVGRKLDFLMQEMNREVNTMGSKANDYEITKNVVELKNAIEKIREQVQNLE
ncbi:YicC/YloC family endoribonuclease [Cellulosilyticum ruminicola]|uniref:YicC/YloC family endoribonuclease n=1 Tax=Cellulosilyticum ruminicola TaxID=425254 RepID=UPI0006CF23B7|nr:YicC/YloC family endoribonuclease [Cellulosilyticum ruminicola]